MDINIEELLYYLNREYDKLNKIFSDIRFFNRNIEDYVRSYYNDFLYFYDRKEYIKAFELENYIWGIIDILLNLKLIEVKEEYKKWFKLFI
ncbi:hypothetical protein MJ1_0418 [Nanobdella aerobiophila]|uniref:DUF357 domain-containing protein n=1 Tax=Nanobdella aerobiophila TaxID=2586965 RepID=A0A915WSQ8_9ARCH|nr:hypothetical protein [Nanobdella aerobiophila]BBL45580.1 hypothetical protein MJ1_0418 [Nanobdella aerobiophila]